MFNVLIVDDEPGALTSLKYMIDWEELGYAISGEAGNGRQALQQLYQGNFDLVITDIRMPGMSGLELIQAIRERSDMPVIVMSGYEDFEYVRSCLKAGVKDYLLKPVDQHQLSAQLTKIKEELQQKRRTAKQLYQSMPILRDQTLKRLVRGALHDADILEQLHSLGIAAEETAGLYTLIAEMDFMDQSDAFRTDAELETTRFAVRNVMEEVLLPYGYVFEESPNRFGVVLPARTMGSEEAVRKLAERVKDSVSTYVKTSVTIGVGDYAPRLQDAAVSFRMADRRLEMKFLFGGQIISAEQFRTGQRTDNSEQEAKLLIDAVKSKDGEMLAIVIDQQKSRFISAQAPKTSVQAFIFEVLAGLFQLIRELEGPYQHIFNNRSGDFQLILDFRTLDQGLDYLRQKCLEVIRYLKQLKMSSSSKTVETVKNLIKENYPKNINLKTIAEEIHMNPTYLGQMFKSAMNMSFNDYLMGVRLERAKFLVLNTDKRIYEIATEVGFRQLDTFYKKFKEYAGKSAGELRAEAENAQKKS